MIPTYRCSSLVPTSMPLDINDGDQNHQASSSSSSLPHQYHDQAPNHLQTDHGGAEKIIIPSGRSWKKEDRNDHTFEGSVKWMSSKMRKISDQTVHKFEDHQKEQLSSSPANFNSCNSSRSCSNHNNNIMSVRVCADCHTTKTPLWRSGPTGPKSLCNACGIRQRKARRAAAAAAAASANGTIVAPEASLRENKIHNKQKKPGIIGCAPQLKRKRKLGVKPRGGRTRNKYGLEDFAISLSKNLSLHQVFPQDEKEAAILLMALSCGLVHG